MCITESGLTYTMSPMKVLFAQLGGTDERPRDDDHAFSNSPNIPNAGTLAANVPTSDGIDEAVSSNWSNGYASLDDYKIQGTKCQIYKFPKGNERIVLLSSKNSPSNVNSVESNPELPGGKMFSSEYQSASVESTGSELELNQIYASKGKMELSELQSLFSLSPKETLCSYEEYNTDADPYRYPKVLNSFSNPTKVQLSTSPSCLPFNASNVISRLGPRVHPREMRTVIIDKSLDKECDKTEALPELFVSPSATYLPKLSQRFCESTTTDNFALPRIANLDFVAYPNVARNDDYLIPEESELPVPFISNGPAEKIKTTYSARSVMSRLGPKLQSCEERVGIIGKSDEAEASPDRFKLQSARGSPEPSQRFCERSQTVSSDSIGIASLDLPANSNANSEFLKKSEHPVLVARLPYLSNDPEENHDNSDPNWDYFHSLNTDDERYRVVRQRWKSVVIPNPNRNLTFQNYRNRWEANGTISVNIDTRVTNKRKRSLTDSTDKVGPVAKRRCLYRNTCSNVFQIKEENTIESYRRKNIALQSRFDDNAQRFVVNRFNRRPNGLPVVQDLQGELNDEEAYSRFTNLENNFKKTIQENVFHCEVEVRKLRKSRNEIIAFHGFYYGLKNSSYTLRNANELSKQQEIEIQEQDDMYSEYDRFYQ